MRRIEAVTAGEAFALLHERAREADELRGELERLRKEASAAGGGRCERRTSGGRERANGVNLIVESVDGLDADALLDLSDRFKQRHAPAAVVLGTKEDGRVHLVANFDDSVAAKVSANDVVGGGGLRRRRRRRPADDGASGRQGAERLPEALAAAEELIVGALR